MKEVNQIAIDFTGAQLRDAGISLATDHAESNSKGWKNSTYELFKEFLREQREPFLMEEFRTWLALNHEDYVFPPSGRAFGGTTLKAVKEGLIKKIGHSNVKNKNAHACFAAVWMKVS